VLSRKPVDRESAMRIILICVHVKRNQADASKTVKEDGLVKIISDGFIKSPSSHKKSEIKKTLFLCVKPNYF